MTDAPLPTPPRTVSVHGWVAAAAVAALLVQWSLDPGLLAWLWLWGLVQLRAVGAAAATAGFALWVGYAVMERLDGGGRRAAREGAGGGPSLALSLALGWGLVSHGLWAFATAGTLAGRNVFFHPWLPPVLFAAALIGLRGSGRRLLREVADRFAGLARSRLDTATAAVGVAALFLMVRGVLVSMTPSFLYDILEYHLTDARHLLATGSMAPYAGNAYSKMPQGVEVLFAFARLMEGPSGELSPKALHGMLGLSTAVLLYALLRALGVRAFWRALALVLFLVHPVTFQLQADAYVGFGSAVHVTAALLAGLSDSRRRTLLAGAFLGFALSTKYPVLGVAAIPFLLTVGVFGAPGGISLRRGAISAFLMGGVALLVWSPWLLRALAHEGSPFPPMTTRWFGNAGGDATQRALDAFMAECHRPGPVFSARYARDLAARLPEAGLLLWLAAGYWVAARGGDRRLRLLAAMAFVGHGFWVLAPWASTRFLAPLVPALVALAALWMQRLCGGRRGAGRLVAAVFLAWAGLLGVGQGRLLLANGWIESALGVLPQADFVEEQLGATGRFFSGMNAALDEVERPRVLLLYEARFSAVEPRAEVAGNTVFDTSPLWGIVAGAGGDSGAASVAAVVEELRRRGFTHVAVNETELARLVSTFPATPARGDPRWRRAQTAASRHGSAYDPRFLDLRHYYAPHFYAGAATDAGREVQGRFDAVIGWLEGRAVWREDLGGARLFVADIRIDAAKR